MRNSAQNRTASTGQLCWNAPEVGRGSGSADRSLCGGCSTTESPPGVPVKVTRIVYRGFIVADVKQETGVELDEALHQVDAQK